MWVADDNGPHNNQLLENLTDLNISKVSRCTDEKNRTFDITEINCNIHAKRTFGFLNIT